MSDLKTQYQFISFKKIEMVGIFSRWYVKNNISKQSIGVVAWYAPWKQYCFFPNSSQIVLSGGCMIDIKNFMIELRDGEKNQADLFGGE